MITEKKVANALGGKTARACDSCLCRRARWFCAADDAFLCQECDASVHSANQLARRHERVRLQTSSFKPNNDSPPAWHQGFTRKARTPRQNKSSLVQQAKEEEKFLNLLPFVPEIGSEEASQDDSNEEQLLYRVPIFDPFASELCNEMGRTSVDERSDESVLGKNNEVEKVGADDYGRDGACELDDLHGLLPSDMDLAEFAADVESLLGKGLDEESCDIKGLGLLDCKEENDIDLCTDIGEGRVKVEEEEEEIEAIVECQLNPPVDMMSETLDWNFDYESPVAGEEVKLISMAETKMMNGKECKEEKREMFLRLNHEAVITAWDSRGSPWTTGTRPDFNPDDCWRDFMGLYNGDLRHQYGGGDTGVGGHVGGRDEGREARVSRYREKRRTRLFSKKIRYEVRKLNAEKRPRMKGRFVKRTSFMGASSAFPYLKK
ncbi:zinc finger protein CONSTANS-LIKE 16-like [Castanea sativa]|uniref:zinc finger protein CONSTANS-LIKE 16-like n=1 Tax=Castanea sativa TaxID=21020 RepID=UPI003F653DD0